jgi:hypothetical protein
VGIERGRKVSPSSSSTFYLLEVRGQSNKLKISRTIEEGEGLENSDFACP